MLALGRQVLLSLLKSVTLWVNIFVPDSVKYNFENVLVGIFIYLIVIHIICSYCLRLFFFLDKACLNSVYFSLKLSKYK